MFMCAKCKRVFEHPLFTSLLATTITIPIEEDGFCPFCYNCEYREAVYCSVCEEWHDPETEVVINGVCESCFYEASESATAINYILKDFDTTKSFQEWLDITLSVDDITSVIKNLYNKDDLTFMWIRSEIHRYIENDRDDFAEYISKLKNFNKFDLSLFVDWISEDKLSFFGEARKFFTAFFYGISIKEVSTYMCDALILWIKNNIHGAANIRKDIVDNIEGFWCEYPAYYEDYRGFANKKRYIV